jgi:hypothetical protein
MNMFSVLSDAFAAVHRLWQLVLMQLLFIAATLCCFVFFIVIPVGIAFVFFSVDLTALFDAREVSDVLSVFRQTGGLLSRYLGVAVMVMFGLLLHLSSFLVLSVINFGGTVGMLTQGMLDRTRLFSFKEYIHEGKQLFGSLFIYSNMIGMLIFVPLFFMGIVRDGAAMLTEMARHQDVTLAYFLNIFFMLLLLCIAFLVFLIFGAMAFYGFAEIARNRSKPFRAMSVVFHYLLSKPAAFGYFTLIACAFFGSLSVLFLLVYLFTFVPLIGSVVSVLLYHAGMAYATVVMFAAVCQYYVRTGDGDPVLPSISETGTSPQPDEPPAQTPAVTAETPRAE